MSLLLKERESSYPCIRSCPAPSCCRGCYQAVKPATSSVARSLEQHEASIVTLLTSYNILLGGKSTWIAAG
jgi:hypothetical protein